MITLGLVDSVDDSGVYVTMPGSRGVLRGPYATLQNVAAGDRVLIVTTDDGEDVIVGQAAAIRPRSTPATSTDNAVARFDGTGGALQNSGVTIDDSGFLRAPGGVRAAPTTGDANLSAYSPDANTGVYLSGLAGKWRSVYFTTDVAGDWQYRFVVGVTNDPESGGHAGSDLYIARWGDGWTNLGFPVKINRATGKITLGDVGTTAGIELGNGGPTITTGAGAPSHSPPDGSVYLRTDGTASTTLYVRAAGAWSALS